jgi:hypothetical protein
MGEEDEATPVGIDEGVALATHDLLAGVVATGPTGFVRFTLWLSMMQALGEAGRPLRSRSIISSAWLRASNTPPSRQAANQR